MDREDGRGTYEVDKGDVFFGYTVFFEGFDGFHG